MTHRVYSLCGVDGIQTAFHAVDSSELKEGDWVAVVGAGGLGQLATQIAKARGIKVVALDINDGALEACKKQGADAVFNSKNDSNYVEELKKLTKGGVNAACVFSNAQAVSTHLTPLMAFKLIFRPTPAHPPSYASEAS